MLGIVGGAALGAAWAGVQIAHSNDPMLANYAIALGAGAGAVVGGLVGAFSYTVVHPSRTQ
ncbi:MAG: hypothetical protein ABI408_08050 [Gemmatimonadaceae bacterium]